MSLGRCFLGISRLLFGPRPSTLVLLRHGEREDYMAEKAGRGAAWISASARPWDPPLAPNGRQQAQSAATRLRQADRPGERPMRMGSLTESAYEQWMRQWAVPGANSDWGGPPSCGMPKVQSRAERSVQGTPVRHEELRPEALEGLQALLLTAAELKEAGWRRVDENYASYVPVRGKGYRWGHFEFQEEVIQRCCAAVLRLLERHPQETLVFVSHGGPTQYCFKELSGQKYRGSSGMCAMSVLSRKGQEPWQVLLANDASHAKVYAHAWAAQRSLQVHHGLARAKRAAAELRQLWRNSVDEGMHTEPEKQEDLRQLELEEREAEVSAWWSRKRLQDLQREVEDLEEHRRAANRRTGHRSEPVERRNLRACQVEAERVAVQEENARVELVDNTRHYMSRARRNRSHQGN
eukprot:g10507.t1